MTVAASMLGATVMPHAIYLHSSLARDRHGVNDDPRVIRRLLAATRLDVIIPLIIAGGVNIAMLLLAAASLPGIPGTDSIEGAHAAIQDALGPVIGVLFGVGLLASGLASTSVGCYAGSSVMAGLLKVRVPLFTRRLITLIPALIILAAGVDPTWALVLSQVFLSIGIPFAMIPLVRLTGSARLMGSFANVVLLRLVAWIVVALIVALNIALIYLTLTGSA